MDDMQITYSEWIDRIFNHDVDKVSYYYDEDRTLWNPMAAPKVTFDHMIRLFEEPSVLESFTDNQLRWGLYYIGANAPKINDFLALPLQQRQRALQSIYSLFEKIFRTKCWPDPFDMENRRSINAACLRWWYTFLADIECNQDNERTFNLDLLAVISKILSLDSDACRESAMIAMGLRTHCYPDEVAAYIDKFLSHTPSLRHELVVMARRARKGFVLQAEERTSVLKQVKDAFAHTQYPGDDNIARREHCSECADIADAFRGRQWEAMTDGAFLRNYEAALSLFKPPAFRYYLPAFICAALVDPDTADVIVDGLAYHLTSPELWNAQAKDHDYSIERTSGFTRAQKAAIRAYLELKEHLETIYLPSAENYEQALHFWSSFAD